VLVTLDWIHVAALVAAAQGFLLSGVLVAHRTNRTANRLLAALMAAFTVFLLADVYYSAGLMSRYPHLFGISYPLPWIFGPLVYLYAVAASNRSWTFKPRDALHFLPVLVVVLVGLPIYLMSGSEKLALFARLSEGNVPTVIKILDPFKYVSGLAYSAATFVHLRRHRRRVENSYSNTERVNLRWLLRLSGAAAGVWLLATVVGVLNAVPGPLQLRSDELVTLAVAVLVYAIGYMGLRQPEIFRYDEPASVSPAEERPAETPPAETAAQPAERVDARYARSGLGQADASKLKAALLALMAKQQPYRDPDLTLSSLAEQLDTTPHKLSEVLNAELSQTFYDFVNSYRVEDVRRRLAEAKSAQLNVLTLAMDAGFASKSTFNQVFKKLTGQTPSTYRKALAG